MYFIWKLVKVLFFSVEKRELATKSDVEVHARRNALAKWLADWVQPEVNTEIENQSTVPFKNILSYLTGNRVRDATREAYRTGNPRLAVLTSQIASYDPDMMADIASQIEQWSKDKTTLNADLVKIYQLLKGDVKAVSAGLDWPRVFGLLLWYKKPLSSGQSLRDTLADLRSLVKPSVLLPNGDVVANSNDVFFRLFQLYAEQEQGGHLASSSSSLLSVIDPTGYTLNRFDYHLTWHLQIVLAGLGKIRFNLAEYLKVTANYALQLELSGLWQWALYVYLNLPLHAATLQFSAEHQVAFLLRDKAVEELLARHSFDPHREEKLEEVWRLLKRFDKLSVREFFKLRQRVECWAAKESRNSRAELRLALEAEDYLHAANVLFDLAPTSILQNNPTWLESVSEVQIERLKRQNVFVGVCIDYIQNKTDPVALRRQIAKINGSLGASKTLQRACLNEMSKNLLRREKKENPLEKIQNFALPEEYRHNIIDMMSRELIGALNR
eukprot:TRINITY_DN4393_c0_g2_i1.p1 TRINITY_DN4393_c0_g2~~TRINITY_DN4393_c0_g2_i1.p1  ORF type:complete len:498 (-),score=118.87 TRINITY_DN4393_c0_g2_i1:28-1521(-)